MDLKDKTMRCLAALFVMTLSIEAQTPQHYHQLQQQNSNHHHISSSGQNENHRYPHSQKQQHQQYSQQANHHHQQPTIQHQHRFQNQQRNQQQHQNRQQHHQQQHQNQQQQHLNQQHQQKNFHVKAQAPLDGLKKQKYQQEKFNQNVQKHLQNHQLEPKHVKNVDELQKEVKFPLERPRQTLPLVLSPEKIHGSMDLDPAITVVEPPKDIAATEHMKTSEVRKRQFSYDAAIAALFQEAQKLAGTEPHSAPLNSLTASPAQFTPLPAAQPIFKFKPVAAPLLEEQLLQNPRPFHLPLLENGLKTQLPSMSFQHHQVNEKQEEEEEEEEEEYQNYAAKYQYGYRVVDDHEGSDFGQTESRDGDMTRGHYHVRLPDGRMQRVKYWSDPSGFHAQISYDRDAVHI